MYRRKFINQYTVGNSRSTCIVINKALQRKVFGMWITMEQYEIERWIDKK